MPLRRPPSLTDANQDAASPRHPLQEVADLLALALLRLRARRGGAAAQRSTAKERVCLGFSAGQRVNANLSLTKGTDA